MNNQSLTQDTTTLAYFLQTGKLGELTLGMNADAILDYLGPQDGFQSNMSKEDFYLWYNNHLQTRLDRSPYVNLFYGNLMITLVDYSLLGMWVYFRAHDDHTLPTVLNVNWLETVYAMNKDAFRQYVRKHQIACERIRYPTWGEDEKLFRHIRISSSDVIVAIDLEDGADYIYNIGISSLSANHLTEPW